MFNGWHSADFALKPNKITLQKTKHMKILQTIIFCSFFISSYSQKGAGITEKLNITRKYICETLYVDSAFANISDAVIANAGINLQVGNPDNSFLQSYYFLVKADEVYSFGTSEQLFQSAEFITTLRSDFKLKTQEDGLKFLSFLYLVDQEYFHKGFFKQNNDWYFVRRMFFDDIIGWKVSTDASGKIISIEYSDDFKLNLPDEMHEAANQFRYGELPPAPEISTEAHRRMEEFAADQFTYVFEERMIESLITTKITQAGITELMLKITYGQEGFSYTENRALWVMEWDKSIIVFSYIDDLLTSNEFLQSIKPGFTLQNEENALIFETFLDAVSDFDRSEKQRISKNNQWIFIRSQAFDDGRGFVVSINEKGRIQSIRYDDRINPDVKVEEPFDESTADWNFQLVDPQNNQVSVTKGAPVYVQISFNETPVNRMGAWILTRYNGEPNGMLAGTEMYSPFSDQIETSQLTSGQHTIDYLLMRPGMDEENPLAIISIKVEVKPFSSEGIDWGFTLLEPAQTDFVAEAGKEIPVKIAFNQQAVRENGVYILIAYKGEIVGGQKPEHMTSPFDAASIPGSVLTKGKHTIDFLLMPPGPEEAARALDVITFNIEVK
jgi:hypothetical protein